VDMGRCAVTYMEQLIPWVAVDEHLIRAWLGSLDACGSNPCWGQHCTLQTRLQVYKAYPRSAEWLEHEVAVAIKMPRTDGGDSFTQSREDALALEVKNIARLQKKFCYRIVRPLGALFRRFRSQQHPATNNPMRRLNGLITEYCEGGSLRNWLPRMTQPRSSNRRSRTFQLPLRARLDVAEQLLQALAHVHRYGLVHLDVKPANMLLRDAPLDLCQAMTIAAAGGSVPVDAALGDFGASRMQGCPITSAIGTDGYWAPEVEGASPEHPAYAHPSMDVWSFGMLLYKLVRDPSADGSDPWDRKANLECEPEYLELIESCLREDPSERATVEHLLAAVRARQRWCKVMQHEFWARMSAQQPAREGGRPVALQSHVPVPCPCNGMCQCCAAGRS
jgi:serine/threonine protein kinase